jgi:hypothetical protein
MEKLKLDKRYCNKERETDLVIHIHALQNRPNCRDTKEGLEGLQTEGKDGDRLKKAERYTKNKVTCCASSPECADKR